PDETSGAVLRAGEGFEFDFDETVLDARSVLERERIGRRSGLFEHLAFGGRRVIPLNGPLWRSSPCHGDDPALRRSADGVATETHRLSRSGNGGSEQNDSHDGAPPEHRAVSNPPCGPTI